MIRVPFIDAASAAVKYHAYIFIWRTLAWEDTVPGFFYNDVELNTHQLSFP